MIDDTDIIAAWSHGTKARTSGVPRTVPKFQFRGDPHDGFGHMAETLIPVGDRLISSSRDSGITVFDRNDGIIVQKIPIDRYKGGAFAFSHNNRYLFADPYICDLYTLEIVYDPWPVFDASEYEFGFGYGFINDCYVIREINRHRHLGVWWVFDLRSWKGSFHNVGATSPRPHYEDPELVACKVEAGLKILRISDWTAVHEKSVPGIEGVGAFPTGFSVSVKGYSKHYLDMYTLDVIGNLNTLLPVEGKSKFALFTDWFSPITTGGSLNPSFGKFSLYAFNWKSNSILWGIDGDGELGKKAIAGDLIFTGVNRSDLIAIDKWSGEIVWRVEAEFRAVSIHFYRNDVYFRDLRGNVNCYEWDEEYISPHRPTDPNELWIRPT